LLSSGVLDNAGQIVWSDSGPLQFGQGAALTNRGVFEVQNDVAIAMTPLVKRPVFINTGTWRKTVAAGLSEFGDIEFRNSGTIDLQSGALGFSTNKHSLGNGTRITGPGSVWVYGGQVTLSGTVSTEAPLELSLGTLGGTNSLMGVVNCTGGTLTSGSTINGALNVMGGSVSGTIAVNGTVNLESGEMGGGPFALNGELNWTGGTIYSPSANVTGNINWSGGVLSGPLSLQYGVLAVLDGSLKHINGGALTNRGAVQILTTDGLHCDNGASIYNYGSCQLSNDAPWAGGSGVPSRFYNYGTLAKAGAGEWDCDIVELHNRGVVEILAGALVLAGQAHSLEDNCSVVGAGRVQMRSGSLALGTNVTCAPLLEILDGAISATGSFNGDIEWSQGSLSGKFAVPAGRQLLLSGAGTKSLNPAAILETAGSVILGEGASLNFFDGAIVNNYGVLEVQSAIPFLVNSALDKPVFNNFGTFRKTISSQSLVFTAIKLQNSGTLEIDSGDLVFSANAHTFNAGSLARSAEPVRVDGATLTLQGLAVFTSPLQLVAGGLTGNGTLGGSLIWSGGQVSGSIALGGASSWLGGSLNGTLTALANLDWSGGLLAGTLNISEQGQLNILAAGRPMMTGVLNNAGRAILPAETALQMDSGAQINNGGVFECSSSTPFIYTTGNRPVFNNNGTFRNLGSGMTVFTTAVEFRHSGALEVTNGAVNFNLGAHSFGNGSVISGPGSVQIEGATINLAGNIRVAGPFTLVSGVLNGAGAIDGDWVWSGGVVSGVLTNPAASRLTFSGNTAKTLNPNATLFNAGTVAMEGNGPLQFSAGTAINNSGLFDWQSEASFGLVGSAQPVFINAGTLRRSVYTEALAFDVVQLQNSGVLDIQAGALVFPTNTHTFSNGSRVMGPAVTRVAGGTVTLNGTVTFDGAVELTAGTLAGNATVNGDLTASGGKIPGALVVNWQCHLVGRRSSRHPHGERRDGLVWRHDCWHAPDRNELATQHPTRWQQSAEWCAEQRRANDALRFRCRAVSQRHAARQQRPV
jgi:hypothetical protein